MGIYKYWKMHGLLDTNVFIYEVSVQKPSQLVLDGVTELIHINWRQSIPQPGEHFEVYISLMILWWLSKNGTSWSGNLILLHYC